MVVWPHVSRPQAWRGDGPVRPKMRPGHSNGGLGFLGKLTDRESGSGGLDRHPLLRSTCSKLLNHSNLAQQRSECSLPSLLSPGGQGLASRHALLSRGCCELTPPEPLTLNTEHVLHILLIGDVEGEHVPYVRKTVITRSTQVTLAHGNYPAHTIQWCSFEYMLAFIILKKNT